MLNNKSILLTGGTGSFGHAFTKHIFENFNPSRLVIYSRDEMKQWDMAKKFEGNEAIRFFIGDVREKDRLKRAMAGIDFVVHAAALKIVPVAEYNPFECIKTNVVGAMNVIESALDTGVTKVIALSTDKASAPINIYGASKLAADKLFISSNSYAGGNGTRFSVVRYGNVMGSRGSVLPFFHSIKDSKVLPITDPRMTRFMITLEQGVDFVCMALKSMLGGEIYVKKIPSMNILDIGEAMVPGFEKNFVGLRPGEKIHEQMIGPEDAHFTVEFDNYFTILQSIGQVENALKLNAQAKRVSEDFSYDSLTNQDKMSISELRDWIKKNEQLLALNGR